MLTRGRFRPGLAPTVLVVVLLPAFLALGFWQLERAAEKERLQASYDARAARPAVRIEPRVQSVETLQFYRVTARGRYEPQYQVLIDNRVHRGRAGYHVITPLRIEDSDVRVLVNRGWIPLGPDRAHRPDIETPREPQEIMGIATVPAEKIFTLGDPAPLGLEWPQVWLHMDMKRYAQLVPFPVQPVVVLLDAQAPGGFVREWARLDAGIAVHYGYAFQWFALAAALTAGYLFIGLRVGRSPCARGRNDDVA